MLSSIESDISQTLAVGGHARGTTTTTVPATTTTMPATTTTTTAPVMSGGIKGHQVRHPHEDTRALGAQPDLGERNIAGKQ